MKLVVKHILRTFKKSPVKPLLIVLTLTVSVMVYINSFAISKTFARELKRDYRENMELGDIVLNINSSSDTRWIFESDIKNKIGEKGEIFGDFEITVFADIENKESPNEKNKEHKIIKASACDLEQADRFYNFRYKEYGEFTSQNLNESVIITEKLANDLDLQVGDTIKLNILNIFGVYKVEAIAKETGILAKNDIILSREGITKIIKNKIPAAAILGDNFTPCNRISVKVHDNNILQETVAMLKNESCARNMTIINTKDEGNLSFTIFFNTFCVFILSLVTLILSSVQITNAMKLLETERTNEYALFELQGASEKHINILRFTESFFYIIISFILGTLLSFPVFRETVKFFNFSENENKVTAISVVSGFLMVWILVNICTIYTIKKAKTRTLSEIPLDDDEKGIVLKNKEKFPLMSFVLTLSLFIILFLSVNDVKYIVGVILLFVITVFAYLFAEFISFILAKFNCYLINKSNKEEKISFLASKSIENKQSLRRVAALLTVLVMIIYTVFNVEKAVKNTVRKVDNFIQCDFIAAGVSAKTKEEIENLPYVENSAELLLKTDLKIQGKFAISMVSAYGDFKKCLTELPCEMPVGENAVLTDGIANILGLKIGDYIKIDFEGQEYNLKISEIIHENLNIIMLDCKYLGIPTDYMLINLNSENHEEELTGFLETRGSLAISLDTWNDNYLRLMPGFLHLSTMSLLISVTVAIIGILNVVSGEIKAENHERLVLKSVGAKNSTVIWKTVTEYLVLLVISLISGLIFGKLMILIINEGVKSFGFTMI